MNSLLDFLTKQIQENGPMPFVQYMQHALYHPQSGYYTGHGRKLGPGGDFTTAPELSPLFAQTLANQCQEIFKVIDNPVLFEFGAGSGRLGLELLKQLEALQCLPESYVILEVSSDLKARQKELFLKEIPDLLPRIHWLDQWPDKAFEGLVIANEILDAMPVHRFLRTGQDWMENFIDLDANGQLKDIFIRMDNPRLKTYLEKLELPTGPYLSEANLFLNGWMNECSKMLKKGAVLLLDYGFPRHEYYHPDRNQGTLMCHHRHQTHSNPLSRPGEEDISAHVDFTHVAEAASEAGFEISGFTSQASFLLGCGLLSLLEKITEEPIRTLQNQLVKKLLQPEEMGELFKVMALTKHLNINLTGFQWQDRRGSL